MVVRRNLERRIRAKGVRCMERGLRGWFLLNGGWSSPWEVHLLPCFCDVWELFVEKGGEGVIKGGIHIFWRSNTTQHSKTCLISASAI